MNKVTNSMLRDTDFSIDPETQILEVKYWGGRLDKFTKAVDLKGWYEDHYNLLFNNHTIRFDDMLGESNKQKVGDFFGHAAIPGEQENPGDNWNRTGGQYETKFFWNETSPGNFELELTWKARAPLNKIGFTGYGWMEYTLDLVCRSMKQVEVLEGNKKRVLWQGTYEFRNRAAYRNTYVREVLNKVPFVKNSAGIKASTLNYLFFPKAERDLQIVEDELLGMIYGHIKKWFS